eukprot:COSAG02_NODE_5339_length_4421_cov_1.716104_7_plen_279_part_00
MFAPEKEGKSVWEYVYDIMTHPEEPHGGVLVRPLYNYGEHSLEPLADMFQHDKVVAGFADGGAHGKGQCEATTPTTMITFWCRDRTRGEHMPIELVVKKQTRDSAHMMGLIDRGELIPGKKADVNVFNLATLDVMPPEYVNDMPLNAGRWVQGVKGYDMTICSGVVTFEHGHPQVRFSNLTCCADWSIRCLATVTCDKTLFVDALLDMEDMCMRALRWCGHPLLNRNRAKGVDRRAYMRAWRARNPGYMARKGREHRERRRLAALALAATNEEVNEGQ